jgi:hypothetical protein
VSDWNKYEINMLNDKSTESKLLGYISRYRYVNKWGLESEREIFKIICYKNNVIWIKKSLNLIVSSDIDYFFLYKEKIYGISYAGETITIYKDMENNLDNISVDNESVLDDIIKNNKTKFVSECIDLKKHFCFGFFYKGILYNSNWRGEICIIKNIAFYNGLLRIEIRNLTFPHTGYALLDIEQCKITEANKIYDPEEPQPAFKL